MKGSIHLVIALDLDGIGVGCPTTCMPPICPGLVYSQGKGPPEILLSWASISLWKSELSYIPLEF